MGAGDGSGVAGGREPDEREAAAASRAQEGCAECRDALRLAPDMRPHCAVSVSDAAGDADRAKVLVRAISQTACAIAATAAFVGPTAASAQAGVAFPAPGEMTFSALPVQLPAGRTFTLREVMPLAIWGGELALQRQSASGAWRTLVSAPVRPRVVWLHWFVPASWRGQRMTVRFRLESGGKLLALSGSYTMAVSR